MKRALGDLEWSPQEALVLDALMHLGRTLGRGGGLDADQGALRGTP
jgi:hypothetical protein